MIEMDASEAVESPEQIRSNQKRTQQTWGTFLAAPELSTCAMPTWATVNRYRIDRVVATPEQSPIIAGWQLLRAETDRPLTDLVFDRPVVRLLGVTQHLHYTTDDEKADLAARSRKDMAPSSTTRAVIIPMRKSSEWWQLAQDRRESHFHGDAQKAGHTKIGAPYVEKIFRKLYHSRFVDTANPWDFVTYFEFPASEHAVFEDLLGKLRDVKLNPEWAYVESEFEVWMTKTH